MSLRNSSIVHLYLSPARLRQSLFWRICHCALQRTYISPRPLPLVALSELLVSSNSTSPRDQTLKVFLAAYMAPEVMKLGKFKQASDVWSYGVCLIELISQQRVWSDLSAVTIMHKVANEGEKPKLSKEFTDPETRPDWLSPQFAALAERCLSTDPQDRPSFKELCDELKTIQ